MICIMKITKIILLSFLLFRGWLGMRRRQGTNLGRRWSGWHGRRSDRRSGIIDLRETDGVVDCRGIVPRLGYRRGHRHHRKLICWDSRIPWHWQVEGMAARVSPVRTSAGGAATFSTPLMTILVLLASPEHPVQKD